MADLIGQTVGDFRIEAFIGRGATGDVYRGAHVWRAERAAIKVLDVSLSSGPGFPDRFFATMREITSFRHSNITEVYDVGEQNGRFFIATELVTAGSLRSRLRGQPPGQPLPLPLAIDLVSQAAEGLAYAHEHDAIHKDIKPSNLLLHYAGASTRDRDKDESYSLKITDFGLARLAEAGSGLTNVGMMLGTGMLLGTPAYMSPEQCRGGKLDERGDLYALGVVLYEMITGYVPFQATNMWDVARDHIFAAPPLPRLLVPTIPAHVEQVVLRCLAKRPEDRYDTATDLAHALQMAVARS